MEKSISMKPLRWETLPSDGFKRNGRGNFKVGDFESHKQFHYWFRLNPSDHMKVERLKEDTKVIDPIFFYDGRSMIGKLHITLMAQEQDKDDLYELMKETICTSQDPIAFEASTLGMRNRLIDEEEGYVLNPSSKEEVFFEVGQSKMLVELIEPPGLPKGKWKYIGYTGQEDNFEVQELDSRTVNGKRMQRILVCNLIQNLPMGIERMRLGKIEFRAYDSDDKHCSFKDKTLNFWVARHRDVTTNASDEDCEFDEEELIVQLRKWMRSDIERKPERSKVIIEEFSNVLTEGANLILLHNKVKKRDVFNPANNTLISLQRGCELVVHMPKEASSYFPPHYGQKWQASYPGNCLKLDYSMIDGLYQKFYFLRDDAPRHNFETIMFQCGERVRCLHVHMDEKCTHVTMVDNEDDE